MNTIQRAFYGSGFLVKDIVLFPGRVFNGEGNRYAEGTITIFLIAALMTFLKAYLTPERAPAINFFVSPTLNNLFSSLQNPQIRWFSLYLFYFAFVSIMCLNCKLMNRQLKAKALVVSLMAISGIGIVSQVVCLLLKAVAAPGIVLLWVYTSYVWVIALTLLALTVSQTMTLFKALICFVISATPIVFLVGFPGISPYLAWLGTP